MASWQVMDMQIRQSSMPPVIRPGGIQEIDELAKASSGAHRFARGSVRWSVRIWNEYTAGTSSAQLDLKSTVIVTRDTSLTAYRQSV